MSATLEIDACVPRIGQIGLGWSGSIEVDGERMRVWLPLGEAARALVDAAVRRAGGQITDDGAVIYDDEVPF